MLDQLLVLAPKFPVENDDEPRHPEEVRGRYRAKGNILEVAVVEEASKREREGKRRE